MDGTNPGGVDPLALSESNDPGSTAVLLAAPLTSPLSEADQRQRDEDRARLGLLLEKLERIPIPDAPEPSPFIENDLLPLGWEWREGENGIVLPVPPPRDPNEPLTEIIRFLDHAKGTINGRPICPGTIAEIDSQTANRLFAYRPMGLTLEQWPATVEYASQDDLDRYEAVMREVDQNEEATANDELSQKLGMVSPETPKLIVRFLRPGMASEKRSCGVGEVWPVEKELAVRHLLEKKPVVELASPAELKSDRDLVDRIRETKKHWNQLGITDDQSRRFAVRYLTSGTTPKGDKCEPGEVWEVDEDHAHSLCRGRSPECELATEHELKAYRAKLIKATEPVEITATVNTVRIRGVDEGRSAAEQSVPQESLQRVGPKCSPCELKAYSQYQKALEQHPEIRTDEDAYSKIPDQIDDGEKLPRKETWIRYVRAVRKANGKQKNQPRIGRTGRSIVGHEGD